MTKNDKVSGADSSGVSGADKSGPSGGYLHTPGPWVVIYRRTDDVLEPIHVDCDGAAIADVYGDHDVAHKQRAHLIAAAPDLLAACESALTCVEALIDMQRDDGADPSDIETRDDLRAAIARARGGR